LKHATDASAIGPQWELVQRLDRGILSGWPDGGGKSAACCGSVAWAALRVIGVRKRISHWFGGHWAGDTQEGAAHLARKITLRSGERMVEVNPRASEC